MNPMLTEKQIRVLRYFRDYRRENGIAPTLDEAAQALGPALAPQAAAIGSFVRRHVSGQNGPLAIVPHTRQCLVTAGLL